MIVPGDRLGDVWVGAGGVAGFGAHSRIHVASIVRLSEDLPIVLEWVDRPDRVEAMLPVIREMVHGGLITVEIVTVEHYQPHHAGSG